MAGLVFVHATGALPTVAVLPSGAAVGPEMQLDLFVCPSGGGVLVHKTEVLVTRKCTSEELFHYSCEDRLLHSLRHSALAHPPPYLDCAWAPSGEALALVEQSNARVWTFSSSELTWLGKSDTWVAWATPAANVVLSGALLQQNWVARCLSQQGSAVSLPLQDAPVILSAVWGSRLAVLADPRREEVGAAARAQLATDELASDELPSDELASDELDSDELPSEELPSPGKQLHIYAPRHGQWALETTLTAAPQMFVSQLTLSADGEL